MSEYGNDKGMGVDCEAMEAEEEAKGRGVFVKGKLTCRAPGAEASRGRKWPNPKPAQVHNLTSVLLHSSNISFMLLPFRFPLA